MLVAFHGRGRIIGHVTGLKVREMTGGLAVTYVTRRSNQSSSLDADWLLLHQGVVSNVQIARSLDCAMRWNDDQACFVSVVDKWGETGVPRVFCAGDGAGIGGAEWRPFRDNWRLSELPSRSERPLKCNGRVEPPSIAIARRPLGGETLFRCALPTTAPVSGPGGSGRACLPLRGGHRRRDLTGSRAWRDRAQPSEVFLSLRDGLLSRPMGSCQGRMGGLTLTEMIAEKLGMLREQVGYFRVRPPIKPVRLSELASIFLEVELNEATSPEACLGNDGPADGSPALHKPLETKWCWVDDRIIASNQVSG